MLWETQVHSLGQKDSLEEGMAIHSNILAWTIPWTKAQWVTKCQTRLKQNSTYTVNYLHLLSDYIDKNLKR